MKIQVWHSKDFDFRGELYAPLKENFSDIEWIFPHETDETVVKSEETLKDVDIFLAEVRTAGTGLGIEIGFAHMYKKRIICIYKSGSQISSSLKYVSEEFIEYEDEKDMIEKLTKLLK